LFQVLPTILNFRKMRKLIYLLLPFAIFMVACEDPIQVDLREDKKELVIDAVINNDSGEQRILLTRTVGYFEPRGSNPPVSGATVVLLDADSIPFFFTESVTQPGTYTYPDGRDFNRIGEQYGLIVASAGDTFVSISTMALAPNIDSLQWVLDPGNFTIDPFYEAEFVAKDLVGVGNTYFIRSFKNDTLLNSGERVTIAYDAAFSPGSDYDGIEFIVPIRRFGINDYDNTFQLGDKIEVQIMGISNEFYLFLNLAEQQINNGGLFATPPANVPSNFINRSANSTNRANGFFTIGQSNRKSAIIQ